MKKSQLLATMVAVGFFGALNATEATAQQPRPVGPVAILDLTYIYKNHPRFQAMTDAMRAEVEAAEKQLAGENEGLKSLAKTLTDNNYKKGSPEYKQIEEELIKRQNDMKLKVDLQRRTFLEQEAKIYYTIYQEVIDHVRYYADQNGISLVLRFNGDPIDRNDPQEVLKELNKSVIYYNRAIDITPIILEKLSPRQVGGGGALPPVQPQGNPQPGPNGVIGGRPVLPPR